MVVAGVLEIAHPMFGWLRMSIGVRKWLVVVAWVDQLEILVLEVFCSGPNCFSFAHFSWVCKVRKG